MTNDSKHLPAAEKWEEKGYKPDVFGRWIGPEEKWHCRSTKDG